MSVEVGVEVPRLVYTGINLTLTFNSRGLSDNLLWSANSENSQVLLLSEVVGRTIICCCP